MYPAIEVGGSIQLEDLPDEVEYWLNNELQWTFAKLNTWDGSPNTELYEADKPNSDENAYIRLSAGAESYNEFIGGIGACLIDGVSYRDKFADQYLIDFRYLNIGNAEAFIEEVVVVSRVSLCVWQGQDQCGNIVRLEYSGFDDAAYPFTWIITFKTNRLPIALPCTSSSDEWNIIKGTANSGVPDEYQNTPIGSYGVGGQSYNDFFGAIVSEA